MLVAVWLEFAPLTQAHTHVSASTIINKHLLPL